jgi:hypothetical protein
MAPDLTQSIRDALIADAEITGQLPAYLGSFPIFTRRPVPNDVPLPLVIVSQDISLGEEDGIRDFRPIIHRDVAVYHSNELPANYRQVDVIAQSVRRLFNRQRFSLTLPTGWTLTDIQAEVPIAVEVEEDKITGRVVQLSIRVALLDD